MGLIFGGNFVFVSGGLIFGKLIFDGGSYNWDCTVYWRKSANKQIY